jgi:Na+/H+ antiporter NhaC
MENQNTNQSLFDLSFNENLKSQLKGAAVWGGIAAITALASSVLNMVKAFMDKNNPQAEYRIEGFGDARMTTDSSGNIVSVVISLIISILLFYFLNRFSSLTKNGLNGNNQDMVSNGLGSLASYFITIGVLIIIILVIFLLVMAGIAAGAGR